MGTKYLPALAGRKYENLDRGFSSSDEWFAEWDRQRNQGSSLGLINLLHWGLQWSKPSVRMVCHYLQIADGHQVASNFGDSGRKEFTLLGNVDCQEVRQKIADKAWMELCNRFFRLGDDQRRMFHNEPTYSFLLTSSELAKTLIWFFDPTLHSDWRRNLSVCPRTAYGRKALAFLEGFLRVAWEPEKYLAPRRFTDYKSDEEYERFEAAVRFYRHSRSQLVEIMASIDWLRFLKNRKLDGPTRRKLQELAFRPRWHEEQYHLRTLEDAYGGMRDFSSPLSEHPEAAEILLLYPIHQKCRRQSIHQKVAKRRQHEEDRKLQERERLKSSRAAIDDRLRHIGD